MRAFLFVISAGCENHGLAGLADDGNAMTVQKKFHIALVGLPGCGKSTIGRYLAKRWSMSFVDVDTAIEEHVGCTIREFFAKEGPLRQVDNPLRRLQGLHALRDPLYKEVADFVVAGSGLSAAQVAQRVAMQVELGHHS